LLRRIGRLLRRRILAGLIRSRSVRWRSRHCCVNSKKKSATRNAQRSVHKYHPQKRYLPDSSKSSHVTHVINKLSVKHDLPPVHRPTCRHLSPTKILVNQITLSGHVLCGWAWLTSVTVVSGQPSKSRPTVRRDVATSDVGDICRQV